MPDDDDEHDSDRTPVASPQARRASTKLARAEACPTCQGAEQTDPRAEPCEVCNGDRFSNDPIKLSAWRMRAILKAR